MILQISAGRGPAEARRFVALLAEELGQRLGVTPELGDGSARLRVGDGERWLGTHQLLAPLRGNGRRKRWFVEVRAFEDAGGALPAEIVFTAARAGGPGGQNVNKRATAVRAVDRVSGLAVRVAEERTQGRNRAIAERRLRGRLATLEEQVAAAEEAARRAAHDQVVRGDARYTWRLGKVGIVRCA
jgi:protein subunit release factor B